MLNTLAELRERRGLSYAQVAAGVQVTEMAVRQWESGYRRPRWPQARRLAAFYGITLDELDRLLPKAG